MPRKSKSSSSSSSTGTGSREQQLREQREQALRDENAEYVESESRQVDADATVDDAMSLADAQAAASEQPATKTTGKRTRKPKTTSAPVVEQQPDMPAALEPVAYVLTFKSGEFFVNAIDADLQHTTYTSSLADASTFATRENAQGIADAMMRTQGVALSVVSVADVEIAAAQSSDERPRCGNADCPLSTTLHDPDASPCAYCVDVDGRAADIAQQQQPEQTSERPEGWDESATGGETDEQQPELSAPASETWARPAVAISDDAHRVIASNGQYARFACQPDAAVLLSSDELGNSYNACAYCADGTLAPADAPAAAPIKQSARAARVAAPAPAAEHAEQCSQFAAQLVGLTQSIVSSANAVDARALLAFLETASAQLRPIARTRALRVVSTGDGETSSAPAAGTKSIKVLGVCPGADKQPTSVKAGGKTGRAYGVCPECGRMRGLTAKGTMRNHPPKGAKADDDASSSESSSSAAA